MHITAPPRKKMTADEFIAWAMEQPETEHYELDDGEIVPMAPERMLHSRAKSRIFLLLTEAVRNMGLRREVVCNGMAVQVDAGTTYEPDVLVHCGDPVPDDATAITDPLIIVEVASPSTSRVDTGEKLAGYFSLPSVRHYLLVDAKRRLAVHHHRVDGGIATRIISDGRLHLDPPGLEVSGLFPPTETE